MAVATVTVLLLLGYGVRAFAETKHWENTETFWTHVKTRNPNCYVAYFNLGTHYGRLGQYAKAIPLFQRASQLQIESTKAFRNYTAAIDAVHGPQAVVDACNERLRQTNSYARAYLERAFAYRNLERSDEAIRDCEAVLQLTAKGSDEWTEATTLMSQLRHPVIFVRRTAD